ncbi:acyl-CoA synthetase [Sphingomonas adhaesiva]|uniref:acyl-CoA synthetase n=1 Tax=Sphingomonas adhaesiva TaxID=28212 RepID=UPI002FF7F05B
MTRGVGLHLTQPLHRALREGADAVATIDGARVRTWRETVARVRRAADVLAGHGVAPGDRVALLAPNGDVFVDLLFGTMWAGGVLVPVNTRWSAAEIAHALVDSRPRVLVIDHGFLPLLPAIQVAVPQMPPVIVSGGAASGFDDWEALLAAATEAEEHLRHGDDLAALLYTGGTTGASKGVMLSHRALLTYAMCLAGSGESAPGACMLHTAPLFHVGALSGLLASLLNRARHVFLPAFEAGAVIAAIAEHRVSDLFLVPTMVQSLLDHPSFAAHDLSCVERVYYGAAPIAPALMDRAIAAMPRVGFVQGYGMTETSGSVALLKPADHRHDTRVRSNGRAVMAIEMKIVDAGDRELPAGERGEIVVRGDAVMAGYWNRPEESAAALRGGWMHTGDVGWMDADGYVHVVDRLKDMILTGGENVFSIEVEGALSCHPAVAQCAVVGRPDDHWGETVHAVVVLRDAATADELIAHCRDRIARYKCPRSVEFRSALPLSAAGKILKAQLRDEAKDGR